MISAQTHFCVCRDGKPVPTFPDHALDFTSSVSLHCNSAFPSELVALVTTLH